MAGTGSLVFCSLPFLGFELAKPQGRVRGASFLTLRTRYLSPCSQSSPICPALPEPVLCLCYWTPLKEGAFQEGSGFHFSLDSQR